MSRYIKIIITSKWKQQKPSQTSNVSGFGVGGVNAKPFEGVVPNTMGSSHVFPKPLGEGLGDNVPSDL